ncbi:MAG: YbbR-like domain-containing protein [Deltaproteobacteria bacterium]|nr:YbbR-like domain-containing protein [Deltaproteobacteria bacterium]
MHKPFFNLFIVLLTLVLFYFPGCTTEPVETDLLLPVDFSNVPANMVLTDFHTDKIEIKIQADPKLMEFINKENFRYPVDLYTDLEFDPAGASDSIEPGTYLIPVEEKRIPMDPAIKILSINPSYLRVRLEKKIKKIFKITVPYIGKPAKGYIALEAATKPARVELTGAFPMIQSIRELKTKPIDLTNVNETFKKKIPLDLEKPSIISSSNRIIIVTVPVRQQLVSKKVENIPIQVWNTSSRVNIEPSKISIMVKGPFETLSNKKIMDRIYSFIDMKGLLPGVYARHAYINIPVGLMMTDADPQVFTVKIE